MGTVTRTASPILDLSEVLGEDLCKVRLLNIKNSDIVGNTASKNKDMPDSMMIGKAMPGIEYYSGGIINASNNYPYK